MYDRLLARLKRLTTPDITIVVIIAYIILLAAGLQIMVNHGAAHGTPRPEDLPEPYRTILQGMIRNAMNNKPIDMEHIGTIFLDDRSPLPRSMKKAQWSKLKESGSRILVVCRGTVKKVKIGSYTTPRLFVEGDNPGTVKLRFGIEYTESLRALAKGQPVICTGFLGAAYDDGLYDCRLE
ncbi:hypothetical protein JW905_19650 [bacterium]|nr:hypothetical protein [candidate division CSSED10-310 bacterium]